MNAPPSYESVMGQQISGGFIDPSGPTPAPSAPMQSYPIISAPPEPQPYPSQPHLQGYPQNQPYPNYQYPPASGCQGQPYPSNEPMQPRYSPAIAPQAADGQPAYLYPTTTVAYQNVSHQNTLKKTIFIVICIVFIIIMIVISLSVSLF